MNSADARGELSEGGDLQLDHADGRRTGSAEASAGSEDH